jgi:hypothetical protein
MVLEFASITRGRLVFNFPEVPYYREAWSSRLGVRRGANNPTCKNENVEKPPEIRLNFQRRPVGLALERDWWKKIVEETKD